LTASSIILPKIYQCTVYRFHCQGLIVSAEIILLARDIRSLVIRQPCRRYCWNLKAIQWARNKKSL